MKSYFKTLFEHEYWANLSTLELIIKHPNPPEKALHLFSHIILSQRLWLDRIDGIESDIDIWEVLDTSLFLELLEINFISINKLINSCDSGQLIQYTNTKGKTFTNTIEQILTHLTHHAAYHRGQVMQLIKTEDVTIPFTDFIVYVRE